MYSRGVKWGITVGHTSIIAKIDEIGKNFNATVLSWKGKLEHHAKLRSNLETIQECIALENEASNIISDDCQENQPGNAPSTGTPLNLDQLKVKVQHKMGNKFDEDVYKQVTSFVKAFTTSSSISGNNGALMSNVIEKWKSTSPAKYQIIGDNVDMLIKIKHQSSSHPNKSIHWFHMNAVKDRVVAGDLPDHKPVGPAMKLQPEEFLPSAKDNQDLLHDFIPLFARVIIDDIPAFNTAFKDVVVRHIPHKYSEVMAQKSEQVNCSVIVY